MNAKWDALNKSNVLHSILIVIVHIQYLESCMVYFALKAIIKMCETAYL